MSAALEPVEAFVPETLEHAKRKAKHLRSALPHLSLGRAQQITAKAMGHADWHALEEVVKAGAVPSALNDRFGRQPALERTLVQLEALMDDEVASEWDLFKFLQVWRPTGPVPAFGEGPDFGIAVYHQLVLLQKARQAEHARAKGPAADVSVGSVDEAIRDFLSTSRGSAQSGRILDAAIWRTICAAIEKPWSASSMPADADWGRFGDTWPELRSIPFSDFIDSPVADTGESARRQRDVLRDDIAANVHALEACADAVQDDLVGRFALAPVRQKIAGLVRDRLLDQLVEKARRDHGQENLNDLLYRPALFSMFRDTEALATWPRQVPMWEEPEVKRSQRPDGSEISARITRTSEGDFESVRLELLLREPGGGNVGILEARLFATPDWVGPDWVGPGAPDFSLAAGFSDDNTRHMFDDLFARNGIERLTDLRKVLHVTAFEVSPSWRGRGYGAALLDALIGLTGDAPDLLDIVCVDIHPAGFPFSHIVKVPAPVRDRHWQEVNRVNGYLVRCARACPSGRWDFSLFARDILLYASRNDGSLRSCRAPEDYGALAQPKTEAHCFRFEAY